MLSFLQDIVWTDSPEDIYFKATPATKRMRRGMATGTIKKTARKPFIMVLKLPNPSDMKTASCDICRKVFTPGNLKKHMRVHGKNRPRKCTYCDREFPTYKAMTGHRKLAHTEEYQRDREERKSSPSCPRPFQSLSTTVK